MGNWREENNCLMAEFTVIDFSQAWAFMSEVAIAVCISVNELADRVGNFRQ